MEQMRPIDPNEELFYTFDWATKRLDTGATVVTSTWEIFDSDGVTPADVAAGAPEIMASPPPSIIGSGTTKVWIRGGSNRGGTYIVTNHIVDSLNQLRDCSGKLKIKAK